jgi:hypothetical protein
MLERIEDDWAGRHEVITASPKQKDGHLAVPDAPGLGVDIREEVIARYPSQANVSIAGGGYEPGTEGEHVYVQTRLRRAATFKRKKT